LTYNGNDDIFLNNMNEGEITITLESEERKYSYDQLGVDYNSSDREIIDALDSMLLEDVGINIADEFDNGNWSIKKVDSSHNIYVFPKSTAGLDGTQVGI